MRRLGDRFSRVLTPEGAEKLGKHDVTGVGLNHIVSDVVSASPRFRSGLGPSSSESTSGAAESPESSMAGFFASAASFFFLAAVMCDTTPASGAQKSATCGCTRNR